MNPLVQLAGAAEWWSGVYNATRVLQVGTTFAHLGGLLVGGGFAIATDAATLRAARAAMARRRRQLAYIHGIHRPVLLGLGLTLASGLLMFAADVETFAASRVFWVKMLLVALLLANGAVMARTETTLRAGSAVADRGWRVLRASAYCSLTLWLAAALAGTLLMNPAE